MVLADPDSCCIVRTRDALASLGTCHSLSCLGRRDASSPMWSERLADVISLRTSICDRGARHALVDSTPASAPAVGALGRSPFLRARSLAAARPVDSRAA